MVENIQIEVKDFNKTLHTAGLYCDTNIELDAAPFQKQLEKDYLAGERVFPSVYINDDIEHLGKRAFIGQKGITSIDLLNCKSIDAEAFQWCLNLKTVNLPSLIEMNGSYTFSIADGAMRDTGLKTIFLPELTTITNCNSTFRDQRKVSTIILPKLQGYSIGAHTFRNCVLLKSLVLGGDEFIPLTNTNAFLYCGANKSYWTTIYVKDNLIERYMEDTNWAACVAGTTGSNSTKIAAIKSIDEFLAITGNNEKYGGYF